jgi:hypothetical protein
MSLLCASSVAATKRVLDKSAQNNAVRTAAKRVSTSIRVMEQQPARLTPAAIRVRLHFMQPDAAHNVRSINSSKISEHNLQAKNTIPSEAQHTSRPAGYTVTHIRDASAPTA